MVFEVQWGKSNWCIDMCIDQGLIYTCCGHGLLSTGRYIKHAYRYVYRPMTTIHKNEHGDHGLLSTVW